MIQFNNLKITSDGKSLIVDAAVKDLEYYTDVYIDSVLIDTQDTFVDSGPSSKAIIKTIEGDNKSISLELGIEDLISNLNENLFFVYIKTKGTPAADTPCGMDNSITLGVTFNFYPKYQYGFNFIKELSNTCIIPKNFINFILQYKAFELAVKTGNYTEAIKYWNKFFMNIKSDVTTTNCNCYGKNT